MQKLAIKVVDVIIILFVPKSLSYDLQFLFAKRLIISFIGGFLLAYVFNFLVKRVVKGFKNWLKDKKRDRRLATKKIPDAVWIGEVTQYLSRLKVAVVLVKKKNIKKGDKLIIIGPKTQITCVANSLQVDNKPVEIVKKGKDLGLLVPAEVKAGDLVYKSKN